MTMGNISFFPSRIFIKLERDASNLLELAIDFSHISAHVREEQCSSNISVTKMLIWGNQKKLKKQKN